TTEKIKRFFRYDKIMVISEHIQKTFEKLANNEAEKSKIVRIYNPLDTEEILTKSEKALDSDLFDDEIPSFVSVGTVFPQKGFDRLLKVHKQLLDEGFLHKVIIIGDGYDFENIKNLKSELKLDKTASMIGFTD